MKKTAHILYGVSALLVAGPIVCAVIAWSLANLLGCQLDEGSVHFCLFEGFGDTLYGLGMMPWYLFSTVPWAIGLSLIALLLSVIEKVRAPKQQ